MRAANTTIWILSLLDVVADNGERRNVATSGYALYNRVCGPSSIDREIGFLLLYLAHSSKCLDSIVDNVGLFVYYLSTPV